MAGAEGKFGVASPLVRISLRWACKIQLVCEPTILCIRVRFLYPHHDLKFPKIWRAYFGEFCGRGRRNRTLIRGFGDRYSTVELCPCTSVSAPSDPAFRVKIAQPNRKSSGNYYTFLILSLQAKNGYW